MRRRSPRALVIAALAGAALGPTACRRATTPQEAAPAGPSSPSPTPSPAAGEAPILEGQLADAIADAPATAAAPAPPEPIVALTPGTDLTLVHDGAAQAVLTAPGVVVILEEDFRHLRAIDGQSGAVRWRALAQTAPQGLHSLHRAGDRVLLHAGPRVIAVDLASGRQVGEAPAYFNGNDMGCRFVARAGACAHACACVLQPVACADGAALGPAWRSDESHIYFEDRGGEHDTVCMSPPGLVGGAGELTVVHHQEGEGGPEVAAIDRAGAVRWRSRALADGLGRIGVAGAEGDLCWLGEHFGELRVFRCSDGQVLFAMSEKTDGSDALDVRGLAGGRLWIARGGPKGGVVTVREGAPGGRARWRRALAPETFALPLGARVDGVPLGRPRRLLVIDPERGRDVFALELGEGAALIDDHDGGYVRSGDDLQELDPRGQLRRRRPRALRGLWRASAAHFLTRDGARVEALRRDDLAPALRLDGALAHVEGEPVGPTSLVFLLHRGERPARLVVLRGAPPGPAAPLSSP